MKHEETRRIVFLVVVAGRRQKDALLTALSESGVHLSYTVYGKGTADAHWLENIFGLIPEENKAVITCIMHGEKSEAVMKMLVEKFHFDRPNTGIAFSVPLDNLSF